MKTELTKREANNECIHGTLIDIFSSNSLLCFPFEFHILFLVNQRLLLYNLGFLYGQNSPCDSSRKLPPLVMTTFVKSCLNCDLNFVMKSSCLRSLL